MIDDPESLAERAEFLSPINKLPRERQARVLAAGDLLELRKKERLFAQGDRDDYTFYLLDGELELLADGSLIKRVSGGEGASFQPLAQLQPRQMSAMARTRCRVLRVRRSLVEQLLSMAETPPAVAPAAALEVTEVEAPAPGDWLMTLLQSDLFTQIPPSNIQRLLDTLECVDSSAGTDIVRQGDPGDYYYIVQDGECEVVRRGSRQREIRLARLGPGDAFGEEALVSGGTRNATVRMLVDGTLARLTKADFVQLVKTPLLDAVDRSEAAARVAAGAHWLDVRFADEHAHNGLPDSINIPVGVLRNRVGELDPTQRYVVYCDTGGRSSAAAFLLAERGFDACFVKGGAVSEPTAASAPPARSAAAPSPAPATSPAPDRASAAADAGADDALVAARARASSLEAELQKAQLTVERARRMMAEAETLKADTERLIEQRVAAERQRLHDEAERLRGRLDDAERLRAALADEKQRADEDANRRQEALEERLAAVELRAAERLEVERNRLAEIYRQQAEALEAVQADRESELRSRMERELATERHKFTQEFLRATEALERAREERHAALAAKESATVEAEAMISHYKAQQEKLLADHRAAFARERTRLQGEAQRLAAQRDEATRARREAEVARAEAERALAAARASATTAAPSPAQLEIIEERATTAAAELQQAIDNESAATAAARDNEQALERTFDTANEINILLQRELDEWVDEQNRLQESTLQREILSRQQEMVDRIRKRAAAARHADETRAQNLLDEIQQQLSGD